MQWRPIGSSDMAGFKKRKVIRQSLVVTSQLRHTLAKWFAIVNHYSHFIRIFAPYIHKICLKKGEIFSKKDVKTKKKVCWRIHLKIDSQSSKIDSQCQKKFGESLCQSDSQLPQSDSHLVMLYRLFPALDSDGIFLSLFWWWDVSYKFSKI